jgi:polysaccharide export outer membrane protein
MLLVGFLMVCGGGGVSAVETEEPPVYLIGPGDALRINVWRQPELSTSTVVRPDGRISIPLVEDLFAAGKTPDALAEEIADRVSVYLQSPIVTVEVLSGLGDLGQQIRVVGDTARPRAIPYRSGMTALDAVIATGGLSRQADGNGAVVVRRTEEGTREIPLRLADLVRKGDSTANMALLPGDVIVIPEGFFSGEWRVDYNASASETFSDNIDQGPSGERKAGLVSRAGPGISIVGNTARVSASFKGNVAGVHQIGGDDEGFSVDPRISGASTTELSPDLLFFDLNAAVSRQLLNSRDSTSGSGASTSNRTVVATMTASPYLVHRLADFANAEWRYSFSPVLIDSGNNADAFSHDGSVVLDSGKDFTQFGWTFSNSVGQEVRTGEPDITTANTDLGLRYPLWRGFSLLGNAGYEFRDGDEDEDNNFDGLTWSGGFQWEPSPDLSLRATYGRQDDNDSLDASLNSTVGAKTTDRASYSEALETGQQRAISNLGRLEIDPDTGEVIDGDTGLPFNGDTDPFTFDDETTRTKTLRLGADHTSGRNSFGLSGLAGTSEGGTDGDEDFYTASVSWGRSLSTELQLNAGASYDHRKFDEDDRTDDTYGVNMGLSYSLAPNARASMSYSFQTRDSSEDDESFYENAVTVGLSFSF